MFHVDASGQPSGQGESQEAALDLTGPETNAAAPVAAPTAPPKPDGPAAVTPDEHAGLAAFHLLRVRELGAAANRLDMCEVPCDMQHVKCS